MLTKTKDGTQYNFSYLSNTHAIDQITMTGTNSGNIKFTYDDFGKMTSKVTTIGASINTMNFTYHDVDLVNIQLPNGLQLDFKYDNKGQRIKKTFKDAVSTLSDNTYVNGFYDIKDGSVNKHISDGQYIIATLVDNNNDNILYYTQNNIGSTSMLTDKDSNKVQSYLFTPYGEPWVTENPTVDVDRKFTGQMFDKESGLYYMNARYMDPNVGIFITPDPAMQHLNHYAYCSDNPIKYQDPTGMDDYGNWKGTGLDISPFVGGKVKNNTDHDIYVVDMDANNNEGRAIKLSPGENSRDKGMKDADVIVDGDKCTHVGRNSVIVEIDGSVRETIPSQLNPFSWGKFGHGSPEPSPDKEADAAKKIVENSKQQDEISDNDISTVNQIADTQKESNVDDENINDSNKNSCSNDDSNKDNNSDSNNNSDSESSSNKSDSNDDSESNSDNGTSDSSSIDLGDFTVI